MTDEVTKELQTLGRASVCQATTGNANATRGDGDLSTLEVDNHPEDYARQLTTSHSKHKVRRSMQDPRFDVSDQRSAHVVLPCPHHVSSQVLTCQLDQIGSVKTNQNRKRPALLEKQDRLEMSGCPRSYWSM